MLTNQIMSTTNLQWQAAAVTDVGRSRETNEDSVFMLTDPAEGNGFGLYLVCDGMGGLEDGQVASTAAVDIIAASINKKRLSAELEGGSFPIDAARYEDFLKEAIMRADNQIRQLSSGGSSSKMGTTVNALIIQDGRAIIANVGDSRAYLWRDNHVEQITTDHSFVNEMIANAVITPEQAMNHPMRNVLTLAVGCKDLLTPENIDTFCLSLLPGDRLLLCSDGLWHSFQVNESLASFIAKDDDPEALCQHLVEQANQRDGSDNISAVVVYMQG